MLPKDAHLSRLHSERSADDDVRHGRGALAWKLLSREEFRSVPPNRILDLFRSSGSPNGDSF